MCPVGSVLTAQCCSVPEWKDNFREAGCKGSSLEDLAQRVLPWCEEDTLALVGTRCTLCEKKWNRSRRQALHLLGQGISRRQKEHMEAREQSCHRSCRLPPSRLRRDTLVKSRRAKKAGSSDLQPTEGWEVEANSQAVHSELGGGPSSLCGSAQSGGGRPTVQVSRAIFGSSVVDTGFRNT